MYNFRLAASRVSEIGLSVCDEQCRLRKARFPHSFWGDVDMQLWLLYVSTPQSGMHPVVNQSLPTSRIHGSDHKLTPNLQKGKGIKFPKGFRTCARACWGCNKGWYVPVRREL